MRTFSAYRVLLAFFIVGLLVIPVLPVLAQATPIITNTAAITAPVALATEPIITNTITDTVINTATSTITNTEKISNTVVDTSAITGTTVYKGVIKVGSSLASEQLLLSQVFVLLLRDAGYNVKDKTGLGDALTVRAALESSTLDLSPESLETSVALFHHLPAAALPADPERLWALVKSLDVTSGLTWLPPITISNTHTLVVPQLLVDKGITTTTALAAFMNINTPPLKICVSHEFFSGTQDSMLSSLEQQYGFHFKAANILVMDVDQTYAALHNGQCEVAEGFAADSRLAVWHLYPLEDTLSFFLVDDHAPVIRQQVLTTYPELTDLLGRLHQTLNPQTLLQLNARMTLGKDGAPNSGDEETPANVAYSFLRSQHLLKPPAIAVGSEDYTEQLILGQMLMLLLQNAGYTVVDKTGIGGTKALEDAMDTQAIDVYPEYASQKLSVYHNIPAKAIPSDPEKVWLLAKTLDEREDIIWLPHGLFNDAYAFMVRDDLWNKGVKTMADLATYMKASQAPLTICMENDFFSRQYDGLPAVEAAYGFHFAPDKVQLMDLDAVYSGVRQKTCDVGEGYRTDGRGAAWGFHNLDDPLFVFGAAQVSPLIRRPVLEANPDLADVLNGFVQRLDDTTMSQLNARVDIGKDGEPNSGDEETPADVAYSFLRSQHLLKPPTIAVGSEDYTEQLILGQMLMLLLQNAGYTVVDKTGIGGTKALEDAMDTQAIDVYPEYASQELSVHHNIPAKAIPSDPEKVWLLAKTLDEREDIIWLPHGLFNDAYAFMVRDDLWNKGVKTMADLATYMKASQAPLTICMENDFFSRQYDGLPAVEAAYGFHFAPDKVQLMDLDAVYSGVRQKNCDVGEGYRTDGRGAAWGFHNLDDPLFVFGAAQVSPLIRRPVLEANPDLAEVLNGFVQRLDDTTMSQLNARVDIGKDGEPNSGDEETPATVAQDFLTKIGLLKPTGATVIPNVTIEPPKILPPKK